MPKLPKTIRARARKLSARMKKLKKTAPKRWKKFCAEVAKSPVQLSSPGWKTPEQAAQQFQERLRKAEDLAIDRAINPPVSPITVIEHLTRRGWETLRPRGDGLYMSRNPLRLGTSYKAI